MLLAESFFIRSNPTQSGLLLAESLLHGLPCHLSLHRLADATYHFKNERNGKENF